MTVKEIPAHLGISAKAFADLMGVTKQTLSQYLVGRRGVCSQFVAKMAWAAGLSLEQIIFQGGFDHPDDEDREMVAYWLSLAAEAVNEAERRGLSPERAEEIRLMIAATGAETLSFTDAAF